MTIEAFLTRELMIRFIDARYIATEARLSLGIHRYPTKAQEKELQDEALKIFHQKLKCTRDAMQQMSVDLENVKIPTGSLSNRSSHHTKGGDSSEDQSSHRDYLGETSSKGGGRNFQGMTPLIRE
jgi:hypothetical protein